MWVGKLSHVDWMSHSVTSNDIVLVTATWANNHVGMFPHYNTTIIVMIDHHQFIQFCWSATWTRNLFVLKYLNSKFDNFENEFRFRWLKIQYQHSISKYPKMKFCSGKDRSSFSTVESKIPKKLCFPLFRVVIGLQLFRWISLSTITGHPL